MLSRRVAEWFHEFRHYAVQTPQRGFSFADTLTPAFQKGERVAEIHERTVTAFKAIELIILLDSALRESQMFHGRRLEEYSAALAKRVKQLIDHGWIEQSVIADVIERS